MYTKEDLKELKKAGDEFKKVLKSQDITEVAEGSSAQKAGIQPGDILISINDTAITSSDVLKNLLYTFQPGDTVNAVIYRSGKQYAVSIPIDEATG